jgi:hypothetical protein
MMKFGAKKEAVLGHLDLKQEEEDIESESLVSSSKKKIVKITSDANKTLNEATSHPRLSQPNYFLFGVFLMVSGIFLLLSLTFLPLILISPNKFNLFFSLCSFFLQLSMASFKGPIPYLKILFTPQNLLISALYLCSLFLAIYSSLIWGTYLSALLMVSLQVCWHTLYNPLIGLLLGMVRAPGLQGR